jgi:hypothetical protein
MRLSQTLLLSLCAGFLLCISCASQRGIVLRRSIVTTSSGRTLNASSIRFESYQPNVRGFTCYRTNPVYRSTQIESISLSNLQSIRVIRQVPDQLCTPTSYYETELTFVDGSRETVYTYYGDKFIINVQGLPEPEVLSIPSVESVEFVHD